MLTLKTEAVRSFQTPYSPTRSQSNSPEDYNKKFTSLKRTSKGMSVTFSCLNQSRSLPTSLTSITLFFSNTPLILEAVALQGMSVRMSSQSAVYLPIPSRLHIQFHKDTSIRPTWVIQELHDMKLRDLKAEQVP